MSQENIIKKLRESIVKTPNGLVRLDLNNNYFSGDFIKKCINELNIKVIMEEKLSDLERLAVCILFDTANIQLRKEKNHETTKS